MGTYSRAIYKHSAPRDTCHRLFVCHICLSLQRILGCILREVLSLLVVSDRTGGLSCAHMQNEKMPIQRAPVVMHSNSRYVA